MKFGLVSQMAVVIAVVMASSAFASTIGAIKKEELLGKRYESANGECSVTIDQAGSWDAACELLVEKFGSARLNGPAFQMTKAYDAYDAIQFVGRTRRPLQALVYKSAEGAITLGLVYGSPADGGIIELLGK